MTQAPNQSLDLIIRTHDPARLEELDRAVFSAALSDHRPLEIRIVCQRYTPAALAALHARLAPILAITPEVTLTILNRTDPHPTDARAALLNLGLAASPSRYAAFLDYDDVIYPEAHRLLIAELQSSGAAIAFGGILTADVTRTGLVPITLSKRRVFQGDGLRQLLHNNFCPLHSFVLDRTRIAPATLVLDETLAQLEDYDLLLRICAQHPASFRLKDKIIGEYVFKDDGSNINPLAGPATNAEAASTTWSAASAEMDARKTRLPVAPAVLAALGITGRALTVAEVLTRLHPP